MDEIIQLQNISIHASISEGIDILFKHILLETKSKYGFYMLRYPPDKEWLVPELYYATGETRALNQSIILRTEILNKYQLVKSITFINEHLTDKHIHCFQLPAILLHPNIQIVIVIVNFDESDEIIKKQINMYTALLCIQFLKKYIDSTINENSVGMMRTIGKIKSPINEIISFTDNHPVIKKSALSLAIIVNDLVDLYKLKRNKMKLDREEIDVRQIFSDLTNIIDFKYSIDDDVPEVLYLDVKRLKQVLLNFISNDSFVYLSASMIIDMNEDVEILCWSLEFVIDTPENVIDERLMISKKLISLMGGYFVSDQKENNVKFTIEACKNSHSYSDNSLKHIKGRKILIIDDCDMRRIDIGQRLQKWEIEIIFASNEQEGYLYLDETRNKIDLFIVGIPTFIEKIARFNIHKPVLQILGEVSKTTPHEKNEYLSVKDTTPINSPRIRKSSVSKPNFLLYPIEDIKLLNIIIDVLN